MTFVAHAVEFLVVAGLLAAAALGAAFVATRRYVRRRWHLVQGHVVARGATHALSAVAAGVERRAARATPAELSRGSAARVRRHMWTAVEDAEGAVAHASAHDAPVAELPSVCRALRDVAGQLDGLLRHEHRLPASLTRHDDLRRQVAEVIAAARDVQAAALRAGSDATEPQVRSLVRRAGDEVEIVSAALRRMRSVARVN
jgi:hypothetical protein